MAIAGQFAIEENKQAIPATMLAAVYRGVNDVRLETVPVPRSAPANCWFGYTPAGSAEPI